MLAANQEAPSLYEIFQPLVRSWKVLFGGVMVALSLAALVTFLLPKYYQTSVVLKIGRVAETQLEDAHSVVETINSESFQHEAASQAGLRISGRELSGMVNATTNPENWQNPSWVRVTVMAKDPQTTVRVANAITAAVVKRHGQLFEQSIQPYRGFRAQLQNSIQSLEAEGEQLKMNLENYRNSARESAADEILLQSKLSEHESQILALKRELYGVETSLATVRSMNSAVTAPPMVPDRPSKPSMKMNLIIAAVAGFFLMISLILIVEQYKKGSLPI